MSNDNIPADDDAWALPKEGYILRFVETEGRHVQYRDRDPDLNRQVR